MIHLLMKLKENNPVFTGLAFSKGTVATEVADYKNRSRQGYHYVFDCPVDSSEDYDGSEDFDESVNDVFIVVTDKEIEGLVYSVHTDREAADLMVEAKSAIDPDATFRVMPTKVNHGRPSDIDDAGLVPVL